MPKFAPVHPHPFAATAQLVDAHLRAQPLGHGLEISHIQNVLAEHGPEFVVAALVQQLSTAIRSPKFSVEEWVAAEIERSEDALQTDAELHILQQNEEMAALGIPAQYRDRLRAWANGAEVEEIQERLGLESTTSTDQH